MALNLIKGKNKFFLQAFISNRYKEILEECWQQNYPNVLEDLQKTKTFASLKTAEIIEIVITSEDLQLISFLKTEIENIKNYIQEQTSTDFKDKILEIKIKRSLN